MKEYDKFFSNRVFTNDEIKKLQEEKAKNGNNKQYLTSKGIYNIEKERENIKIKENDYENIKEKLNDIFKKYYERLAKMKISTLEEFYDMIMVSFVFYEQFERISLSRNDETNSKLGEFKNSIREYNRLKAERSKYSRYNKKYITDEEIKRNRLEIKRIDIRIDEAKKEITKFTNLFLSELGKDYENFRNFIKNGENIKTLAQLTSLNKAFEELEEINIFENYTEIRNKLENYVEDMKDMGFAIDEKDSAGKNIENIISTLDKGNDIINVLMHFPYANILMRNNIMKFPLISEEYRGNSSIIEEIKALKLDVLNYYRDSLTYRNNIKIDDEIIESHNDTLFYDLLYLQYNRGSLLEENTDRKNYKTFDNLDSSKGNYEINSGNKIDFKDENDYGKETEMKKEEDLKDSSISEKSEHFIQGKIGKSKIRIDKDNITINCNLDDFIQISNALEMIEKLKGEDVQKNILAFLDKDDKYYENKKFRPKSKFMSERVNILKRIETVTEIEEKLMKKGMKLISSERRLIFSLLEKTEKESKTFKSAMLKMFENPLFTAKIIKAENTTENQGYKELCWEMSYIEKMNYDIRKFRINGLSDKKGSLRQLDNLYNFDFETLETGKINPEIIEKLKEYQENYRKIVGGEDYETL
jgi:hypothetical protein